MENANVEVPVTGTAPTGVSQNTGVLPEIQMPDDIEEDKKELQAFKNAMESSLVLDSKEIFKAVQRANRDTFRADT